MKWHGRIYDLSVVVQPVTWKFFRQIYVLKYHLLVSTWKEILAVLQVGQAEMEEKVHKVTESELLILWVLVTEAHEVTLQKAAEIRWY